MKVRTMKSYNASMLAALFLALLVALALPINAYADSADNAERSISIAWENPLYSDSKPIAAGPSVVAVYDEPRQTGTELLPQASGATRKEAVQMIKGAMANREASLSFTMTLSESEGASFADIAMPMVEDALEEDGNPMHGDYLRWVYNTASVKMSAMQRGALYYVTYTYAFTYKTTAAQEKATLTAAQAALAELNVSSMSTTQEKVRAIYDYICSNVKYDNENLNNNAYDLKYTAYAALINHKAVCQGYASLFYLMAGLEGIPTRIIAGTGTNSQGKTEGHAWNIVKIGSYYYNLDATWDTSRKAMNLPYDYYLKNDADFAADHKRDDGSDEDGIDYTSTAFYASYPMSPTSYNDASDPGNGSDNEPVTPAPASNTAKVANTSVKQWFKVNALKAKAGTIALPTVTATYGANTAVWKVTKKDAKGALSLKSGKVKVKKGTKKGTYTIKLKATIPATATYKAATTKVVTVKAVVKK